jgi:hypothetical protein
MTFEARLAFIVFFFLCWTIVALLPWAVTAVVVRGRGAIVALPLAVFAAWAAGVLVPLAGWRDAGGFFFSLLAALTAAAAGSVAGIAFARRLQPAWDEGRRPRPAAGPRARLDS